MLGKNRLYILALILVAIAVPIKPEDLFTVNSKFTVTSNDNKRLFYFDPSIYPYPAQGAWLYYLGLTFNYEHTLFVAPTGNSNEQYRASAAAVTITGIDIQNLNNPPNIPSFFPVQTPKITPNVSQNIFFLGDVYSNQTGIRTGAGTLSYYINPSFLENCSSPTAQEATVYFEYSANVDKLVAGGMSQFLGRITYQGSAKISILVKSITSEFNDLEIDFESYTSSIGDRLFQLPGHVVPIFNHPFDSPGRNVGFRHKHGITNVTAADVANSGFNTSNHYGYISWDGFLSENNNFRSYYFNVLSGNSPNVDEVTTHRFFLSPATYSQLKIPLSQYPSVSSRSVTANFTGRIFSKLQQPPAGSNDPPLLKVYLCSGSKSTLVKFIPSVEIEVFKPSSAADIWTGNSRYGQLTKANTVSINETFFPVTFETSGLYTELYAESIVDTSDSQNAPTDFIWYYFFDLGERRTFQYNVPYMGWSDLFIDTTYGEDDGFNHVQYPDEILIGDYIFSTHGIWHRKPLTGSWRVTFSGLGEEIFTVQENYSGNFDIDTAIPYPEYDITATGSNGTVFVGKSVAFFLGDNYTVQIRGTFANPAFGVKTTKVFASGFGAPDDHIVKINAQGKIQINGRFTNGTFYNSTLELNKSTVVKKVFENDSLFTVELPRAVSPSNKSATKADIIKPNNAELVEDMCNTGCPTCFADPITNKTVCFDVCAGDPININNLEYTESASDLIVRSRGVDFTFTRTYRSRIQYDGPLGHNWEHNYNKRFVKHPDNENILVFYNGAGRGDAYLKQSDSTYLCPEGYFQKLVVESDGFLSLRNFNGTISKFYPLDETLRSGQLAAIVNRCGNQLVFDYNAEGLLSVARDSFNRVISFHYNADKRIERISAFTGQEVVYGYSL